MARLNRPTRPNRGGSFEKWTVRLILPALLLAMGSVMLGLAGVHGPDWRGWFDGPERGTWRLLTINGEDVSTERMSVTVQSGEIVAGRDGCNYWNYSGEADPVNGERMMTSTLAGCMDTPAIQAYRKIAHGGAILRLLDENHLEAQSLGTVGQFIRWTDAMEEAERAEGEREVEAARNAEPLQIRPFAVPLRIGATPPPPPVLSPRPPPPPGAE